MKRISLSWLHILIVLVTFIFTFAKGQDFLTPDPILLNESEFGKPKPEIIAYQLVPSQDDYCHFEIEILQAFAWDNIPNVQREETKEMIEDRIVFEETNPWAVSEVFFIDGQAYFLVRVPWTGVDW